MEEPCECGKPATTLVNRFPHCDDCFAVWDEAERWVIRGEREAQFLSSWVLGGGDPSEATMARAQFGDALV